MHKLFKYKKLAMNLRKRLKNTLLISKKVKQKLLALPNWPEELENTIKEIFNKY
jgi:hypothetical protein